MPPTPDRLRWFCTLIPTTTAGRILEVGCGNGQLLALLAERSPRATLVGIDRSALQVRRAVERLAAHSAPPAVHHLSLQEAGAHLGGLSFTWIVAMNVNLFWTNAEEAFAALRPLLAPRGRILLGYEAPTPRGREALRTRVRRAFVKAGLDIREAFEPEDPASGAFAIAVRLTRG